MDEIETINIELKHSVAKLLSENELLHKEIEHLKKIYKDQFDSIKKTRALSKEHCDSLIAQLNSKSGKCGFKSKGIALLSEAVILEEAQMKKAIKRSKRETYIHQAGGSSEGAGLELEVPIEQKRKSTNTRDSDDDNDNDDQQSDDEQNVSNNPRTSDDKEETQDDEFVHTPENYEPTVDENVDDEEYECINKEMYDDVNVDLKDTETADEGKGDEEMTDAEKVDAENENVNQEVAEATISTASAPDSSTLTAIHQRLSDLENEVKTLRNVDHSLAIHAAIKSEVTTVVKEYLGTSLDDTLYKVIQRHTAELVKEHLIPADVVEALYHALMESILEDKDAMDKGVINRLKMINPDDADKDEGPPAGPDQGLKRKKTGKDTEPSKKAKTTGTSKGTTKSQPKSTGKSTQAEEAVFEAGDTQVPQDLGEDMGNTDEPPIIKADPKDWFKKPERPPTPDPEWNECKTVDRPACKLLKGTCRSYVELEYNMEECYKALNDQLDLNNPKVYYFFNNDLAYRQGGSIGRSYTTFLKKTKDAKYDLQGIKDMVPNLWIPVKVAYNRHALLGTSHWISKRQTFYGYASNRVSKHDVYSTKRILAVTNVKVNIWYGYGHLEEIVVRRFDQLFNLKGEDIVHPAAALHMFTRRVVIHKRVEDLQLGVESYQKKLKISRPLTHKAGITDLELYTTYSNPQGVIYLDKLERNKLMCSHELCKFSDDTLISVRDKLKYMLNNLEMGQNWRDLPRDIPLDRIEVLRYDTKGVKVRKRKMQTKTELTLKQTQQDVSDEVLIVIMDPVMQWTALPSHSRSLKRLLFHFSWILHTLLLTSHSELFGIEKVAVCSSLRLLKPKCTIDNILRVLRIILVILPEHQSDTKSIHSDDGNPSRANIKQAPRRVSDLFKTLRYENVKCSCEDPVKENL
ncbi:hypothetical protein Tco_0804190 [Tanacetum coccineum]|uniref:Uncharacterized protein n=1 Tax=Tanacetum coccineum TaxID=301880 RepID=A0ABQ5A7F6_9ASTR